MAEVIVFLIVGSIAILSAALMLMSQNTVHSALFLVLNFVCVAFFFLTLGASFIALAQIAVYAGAIMVLFLFVIMLLGAERVGAGGPHLRWLPGAALVLAMVFLLTVGAAIASGQINLQAPPTPDPRVRIVHAADPLPVDVYFNDQATFQSVDFRATTDYASLTPGEYGIAVYPAGADRATESPAMLGSITLEPGETVTLVAVGANGQYALTPLRLSSLPVDHNRARLTLINGLPDGGTVDLVDPGAPSDLGDDRILIQNAPFGETVETVLIDPVTDGLLEVRTPPAAENTPGERVTIYRDLNLTQNTNNLLIVASQPMTDGNLRIVPLHIAEATMPLYGSPAQIGGALFTTYLLPFEIVGVLLLVAIIGAVALTREELLKEKQPRRVVRHPLVGPAAAPRAVEQREREGATITGPGD